MSESFDADQVLLKHIREKKFEHYQPNSKYIIDEEYQSQSFNEFSSQQVGNELQQNENQNNIFHRQITQFETSREKNNFSNSSNNQEQQQLNDSADPFSPPVIKPIEQQTDNMKSLQSEIASLKKKLEKSEKNNNKILELYGKLKNENQQLIKDNLKLQQSMSQLKEMISNPSKKSVNINQQTRISTPYFGQRKLNNPPLRHTLTPSFSTLYLLNQYHLKKNNFPNEQKVIQKKPFDIKKLKNLIYQKLNLNQYTPKTAKSQFTAKQKQKQQLF